MPEIPTWAWIIWVAVTVVSFAVLEALAILNGPAHRDTLSDNIRRLIGVDPPSRARLVGIPLFLAVLLGFVAWFIPHILAMA
ncbi:MAG: hypothetical protein ACRDOO_04995 [Actinomadura sp.]